MKRILSSFAVAAMVLTGSMNAFAQIIYMPVQFINCEDNNTCVMYVDDSFTGTGGGTKSNPYKSITPAMNFIKASDDYSRIYIAGGTYDNETLPFEIDDTFPGELQILGGYNSTFTTRNPELYPTVIQANGEPEVLDISGVKGIVDGVIFEGTGVGVNNSHVLRVTNTGATTHNFKVTNNIFRNNDGQSGSILTILTQGSNTGLISENTFYQNDVTDGYIVTSIGEVDTTKNLLYANSAGENIFACSLDGLATNNFLLGNLAPVIAEVAAGCAFIHNTVVDNDATGPDSAVMKSGSGQGDIRNNIFAYNGGFGPLYVATGSDTTFDYNAIFGNLYSTTIEDNNMACDPLFADKDSTDPENVKLGAGSACIDAGINISPTILSTDYFGASRPLDGDGQSGATNDPGAHEAEAAQVPAPVISNMSVSPNPFSPNGDGYQDTTTISFNISQEATVSVDVIIDNSKIQLLENTIMPAGSVSVTWDSSYIDNNNAAQEAVDGTYDLEIGASNGGGSAFAEPTVTIDRTIEEPETPAPGGQCAGYTDVSASHSSCDAIEYVQSIGAMTGNPDGTFAPNELLQRDQVAKISLETFGLFNDTEDYCNGTDPFPDVPPAQWSYQYICRGVDVGMITGYEGGADAGFYRPARQVNRVEFLALILRNLSDTMPADSSTSYSDVEANQWFSGYARYSLDNDLFAGPNLMPTNGTKRVEVADVLYKLHNAGKI